MRCAALISLMALLPLPAQAQDLRPVPDYFAEAIFASNMARSLADLCASVEIDPAAVAMRREELLTRLRADGFDGENAMSEMEDPTGPVHALQSDFLEKYPLETATNAQVCAAALSEMGNGTLLGSLLREVGS